MMDKPWFFPVLFTVAVLALAAGMFVAGFAILGGGGEQTTAQTGGFDNLYEVSLTTGTWYGDGDVVIVPPSPACNDGEERVFAARNLGPIGNTHPYNGLFTESYAFAGTQKRTGIIGEPLRSERINAGAIQAGCYSKATGVERSGSEHIWVLILNVTGGDAAHHTDHDRRHEHSHGQHTLYAGAAHTHPVDTTHLHVVPNHRHLEITRYFNDQLKAVLCGTVNTPDPDGGDPTTRRLLQPGESVLGITCEAVGGQSAVATPAADGTSRTSGRVTPTPSPTATPSPEGGE